ncbi:MAG: hypothetical protein LQ342_002839 [Letrouitia transgressa]|nr:MAG: hypothetical protein LQ342_002839 [Letrouitia transgressa]
MTIRTNRFPDYAPLASSEVDLEAPQDAKASDPKEESYRNHLARAIQVFMVGLLLILATSLTVKWTAQRVILSENRCDNIAIRKEWRNLNDGEKTAYLRAVQCLRTIPSRLGHNQTLFDDFAYFHTRTGAEGVYEDEALSFTKVLMSVNSTLYGRFLELASMVPAHVRERYARAVYWDWTLDWDDLSSAPVWDDQFGFGGSGNTSANFGFRGYCVTDGPFANFQLLFIGPMEVPHCLSREFLSGEELTHWSSKIRPENIAELFERKRYKDFVLALEEGPHLTLPHFLHGDFSVPTAPQDPIFWMHHAQIDSLWWKWQQIDRTARLKDYGGRLVSDGVEEIADLGDLLSYGGLGPDVRVSQVMDTEAWPLCYKY